MSSRRVVAVVQARMGSTRLPGKSLADVCGRPLLAHVLTRVKAASCLDQVVLATTTHDRDGALVPVAEALDVPVFRGSESDVLDRFHGAAVEHGAGMIVRITADCPLVDPDVIGRVVAALQDGHAEYASNVEPRSFPKGLDAEAFTFDALDRAWLEATAPYDREHVTPYLRRDPQRFRHANISADADHSVWRWTVDDDDDLEFVRRVYARLWRPERPVFAAAEVYALLAREPELVAMCDRAGSGARVG